MKKNILILCLSFFLLFSIILNVFQYETQKFLQNNVDSVFENNFSLLCVNLRVDEKIKDGIQWNQKNEMYAYTALSLFSSTSYAHDVSLNDILISLYGYSQAGTIKDKVSFDAVEQLNRLAYDLKNKELSKQIYQDYFVL